MRPAGWSFVLLMSAFAAFMPAYPSAQNPPLNSSNFFNQDVVQQIELWFHDEDWEKLKQNFQSNEYYPADVIWNNITVRNVGIRSRGFGSRRQEKPGLRVDIDHYSTKQTFLGLKSFILDNLTQDASGIHETTAMRVYARMGIPASRETFARLIVQGEYVGLYGLVESVDKTLLARVFGSIGDDVQNDGVLYEYKFTSPWRFTYLGSDLAPYKQRFDAKTHEDKGDEYKWRKIEELVRRVNELPSDRFMSDVDPLLDLRAFIRYQAVQNFLGENDGFVGYDGMNNFYFYRKESSDQHVFIAWDEDNAFWGPEFPLTVRHEENVLMRKAMEVGELRDLYYATLAEVSRMVVAPASDSDSTGWLESIVRRQLELVDDPLREDHFKPYSNEDHDAARTAMIIFSRERSRYVDSNLPR